MFYEKMLVKVRNRHTKEIQFVSKNAYEMAKRNYDFIAYEKDDKANVFDPNGSTPTPKQEEVQTQTAQIQTEDSPNSKPTDEKEKAAVAVEENTKQPGKKRGPKPKSISSSAATVEV